MFLKITSRSDWNRCQRFSDCLYTVRPLARIYRLEYRTRTLPATHHNDLFPASNLDEYRMLTSSSNSASACVSGGIDVSAMTWREYHGITKHSVASLRRA